MSTSSSQLLADIAQLHTDSGLMHSIVHGSENSSVVTEGGPVMTVAAAIKSIKTFTMRGTWVTGTPYGFKDLYVDPTTNIVYMVVVAHTATTIAADLAAGKVAVYQDGAFLQDGPGSVPRTFQSKMRNVPVSPEDKGAAGDGVTLDDAAFAQLAAMAAGTVIDGGNRVFLISQPITFSNRVSIRAKFKLHPSFPQGTRAISIAADDSEVYVDVDANTRSLVGVAVTGNRCRGKVTGRNVWGASVATGGSYQSLLLILSDDCIFDVDGTDMLAAAQANTGVPRVLSTGPIKGCRIGALTGSNINALWVNQAGDVSVDFLWARKCGNNGIYDIAAGSNVTVGTAVFEDDLGLGLQTVVSEGLVTIQDLVVRDVYGYAAVDFGGSIIIGNYSIITLTAGKTHQPMISRANATNCSVRIGSLSGNIWLTPVANGGGVFQFFVGTINQLEVGRIALDLYYQAGSTKQLLVQTNGSGAMCAIDDLRLRLFDTTGTLTSSDIFSWQFPSYSLSSYLNHVQLVSSPAAISVSNLLQANMRPPANIEVDTGFGSVTSVVTGTSPRVFFLSGIPTGGTYRTGDVIKMKFPTLGKPVEYVCIAGGTPGTWTRSAGTTKRDVTANRPTGLTFQDIGTLYFDSTLAGNSKPIWWSGTAWIDATGAAV